MRIFLLLAITFGLSSAASQAPAWSDVLYSALSSRNDKIALERIKHPPDGCSTAPEYISLEQHLKSNAGTAAYAKKFQFNLDDMLTRAFTSDCLVSFLTGIEDPTLPGPARMSLLRAVLDHSSKTKGAERDSLISHLAALAEKSYTPVDLSSYIVRNAPLASGSEEAPTVLGPFLSSDTPPIRQAAAMAMSRIVRKNRMSGAREKNRSIFDDFSALQGDSLSLDQVRILASIGEDFARAFLLTHCSGNPERIAAIFYRDDSLAYLPILKEALRLMKNVESSPLPKAIRTGLKDPSQRIQELMAGSSPDFENGFLLLSVFPEYISQYGRQITENLKNSDPEIRTAATRIAPYLNHANEAAQ